MTDYSKKWEEHGKKTVELKLMASINSMEWILKMLSRGVGLENLTERLSSENKLYNLDVQFYKKEFEYENIDLQKQYEKMLPEINKYIGENEK